MSDRRDRGVIGVTGRDARDSRCHFCLEKLAGREYRTVQGWTICRMCDEWLDRQGDDWEKPSPHRWTHQETVDTAYRQRK